MSNEILISPSIGDALVSATESARQWRDGILRGASNVLTVSDRLDADDALAQLRNLKTFSKEIEVQRKQAKDPITKIGKQIDVLAAELTGEVDREAARISCLVGSFEAEERRKADRLAAEARAEAARIEAEARAKIAKEIKAEAAKPQPAVTQLERRTDEIIAKANTAIAEAKASSQQAVQLAPAGTAIRHEVKFEVDDIRALFEDMPELVILTPNTAAIKAIIKANPEIKLKGLRHWTEAKASIR
jgi:hypothetical protein